MIGDDYGYSSQTPVDRHFYEIRIHNSVFVLPQLTSFMLDRRPHPAAERVFVRTACVQGNTAKSHGPAAESL